MFLPLYCVSFGLRFWLPLEALLVFMFMPLHCVSFGLRLLITPSSFSCLYVLAIVLCVLRCTASGHPFKLFLSLCSCHCIVKEQLKRVIRNSKQKNTQYNGKNIKTIKAWRGNQKP
jgi:hypothetical protein